MENTNDINPEDTQETASLADNQNPEEPVNEDDKIASEDK